MNNRVHFWLYDRARAVVALKDAKHVPAELERAARMGSQERRQTFLATRSLLRKHLAEFMVCGETEFEISADEWGKPRVNSREAPSFSVSHSGDRILIAVDSSGLPIGIDIEKLDGRVDFELLARHLFSDAEKIELARAEPELKLETAMRSWCRKEARFKLGEAPARRGPIDVGGKIGDYVFEACFLSEQPT